MDFRHIKTYVNGKADSCYTGPADVRLIREELAMLEKMIREASPPKVCLMSSETLLMTGLVPYENKEFRWNGIPVIIDNRVEYGKMLIMNAEDYEPPQEGKPEPKAYHCRVCGTTYYSKQEAKECQRSHDWQNRHGRR